MTSRNRLFVSSLLVASAALGWSQFGWGNNCIDPQNTAPRTTDHSSSRIGNEFIIAAVGFSGAVTYGAVDRGPCYFREARTLNLSGRLGFQIGPVGSIQTDFDDFLALTMGMPRDPAGDFCYARVIIDTSTALFGDGGMAGQFVGLSRRYMVSTWRNAEVEVELETRVIGDASRQRWRLRNRSVTTSRRLGLKFGAFTAMRSAGSDRFGHNQAGSTFVGPGLIARPSLAPDPSGAFYVAHIETPTTRPVRSEKNWLRASPRFPDWVNFQWSQSQPYGMRVENSATPATQDASEVWQFLIGNHGRTQSPNLLFGNNMSGRVFNDLGVGDPGVDAVFDAVREDSDTPLDEASFIQVFQAQTVAPLGFRDIVHYVRAPWSVADYLDPYSVVIDAPRIVETDASGLNGLSPNPMTVAAYIDNQYADLDQEFPLTNVRVTISFPPGSGLSLAAGETAVKTIARVEPAAIGRVLWQIETDGTVFGNLPYKVTFQPTPGPLKEITGTIQVAATPRLRLPEGATLVSIPWDFPDTSLNAILAPLQFGTDYVAYRWDPSTASYQPALSAVRGESIWIVANNDGGFVSLNNAAAPADQGTGGVVKRLEPGWNMFANPYSFPVPIAQLVGVGGADPARSLTWRELVDNGWVSPGLAFWERDPEDPTSGAYRFTVGDTDFVQPNVGYWIFNSTFQPIDISWPPVFISGLQNTVRRGPSGQASAVWQQSDRQWRLQLVARNDRGIDSQNFVGLVASGQAKRFNLMKPPRAPKQAVELSLAENVNGRMTRMAASFAERSGRRTWSVNAFAQEPGEVTVTWPNIGSVPRNVRFTLRDDATGETRDLRFHSGYTFRAEEPGVRNFTLTMEPAGASRALIGSVNVTRSSRDASGPVSITWSLSSEAVTTVRILGSNGREVFTVQRGRAATAGDNSVTWALRDNSNRAVAPGVYQVEIVAETASGERVRRIVPVNVVR